MTLKQARHYAQQYSIQYGTWFVREVEPGIFEPWAHSEDDGKTVACFIGGKEFKEGEE